MRIKYFSIIKNSVYIYWEKFSRFKKPLNKVKKLQNNEF